MLKVIEKIGIRELHMILIGVGLMITSFSVTSMLVPEVKAYLAATRTVSALRATAKSSADLELRLQARHGEIDDLKYRLHGDLANLPLKEVEAHVIGRLQKISWHNEVELVSVEPAIGQQVQIFSETLFHIELVGQYENIYRWLWDAKKELGFVVVKEYSIRRRDNVDDDPSLLAEVSLASYRAEQ